MLVDPPCRPTLLVMVLLASYLGHAAELQPTAGDRSDTGAYEAGRALLGDGPEHLPNRGIVRAPAPNWRPQSWLQTAPACGDAQACCAVFGMNCIGRAADPRGGACTGTGRVLCAAPEARANSVPDSVDQLNVLSYNVFSRPFVVSYDGQAERTCRIPGELADQVASVSNVDVLVIQEAFTPGCRSGADLRTLLSYYGWPYSTRNVGQENGKPADGGIFIASRWPILENDEIVYSTCSGTDCLAAKGAAYARILKAVAGEARRYNVFGTHFNAGDGAAKRAARLEQARQLHNFASRQDIPVSEAVVIAGDLNVDNLHAPDELDDLLAVLGAKLPEITGLTTNTTGPVGHPLHDRSMVKWLDYVVYLPGHAAPQRATLEAIPLRTRKTFDVCMSAPLAIGYVFPNSRWCLRTLAIHDLSDHYPVLGRLSFPSQNTDPCGREGLLSAAERADCHPRSETATPAAQNAKSRRKQ